VETRGEVMWSTFSGQCGIRFLDPSARLIRQIDEWIFGDLLEGASIPTERSGSLYADAASSIAGRSVAPRSPALRPIPPASTGDSFAPVSRVFAEPARRSASLEHESVRIEARASEHSDEDDGLIVSPAPVTVIELPSAMKAPVMSAASLRTQADLPAAALRDAELDWLSQPLSTRTLAWTVDTLVVIAALLLFVFVFLSVTREAPKWPISLTTGGAIVIGGLYWGFFKLFGGSSLGSRLARLAESSNEEIGEAHGVRFR
jgi:hypothetical protein